MKPELETALTETLQGLLETVSSTKDFVAEQVPLLVQELTLWKRVQHSVSLGVALFLVFASIVCVYKLLKWTGKGPDEVIAALCTILSTSGIISFIWGIYEFCVVLQIWLAPRIFVLEYIKDML